MRWIPIFLVGAALVVAAAGCGSKSSSSSATDTWASGLCSAVTTYQAALTSAGSTLKAGGVTKTSLQSTANDVSSATDTFVSTVKGLGKPQTTAGAQARQSVDTLSSELQKDVDSMAAATADLSSVSGVLTAVSTVGTALAGAGTQISETWHGLQQLDAKGELTKSFSSADECKSLDGR